MRYLKPLSPTVEEQLLTIIAEGLSILRSEAGLSWIDAEFNTSDADTRAIEDRVSRALYRGLEQAVKNTRSNVFGSLHPQMPIKPNPNVSYEPHESKIPDFTWEIINHTENPPRSDFHIECKRLGSPSSSSWKLNAKYVENGIIRFVSGEYRYGKDVELGIIIGYLEDMNHNDILQEVNSAISRSQSDVPEAKLTPLEPPLAGWQNKATSRLSHKLERSFPKSPFTIQHFWLDLRNCYPRTIAKSS